MIKHKEEYYTICQHCDAINKYGLNYYKCCNCGRFTIPIVERDKEVYENDNQTDKR
jgi:hypothetical protein